MTYPEITEAERLKLVAMGWLFNPQKNIWMYAPGDVSFSANQADHDRQFPHDLALARLQVLADESDAGNKAFDQPHHDRQIEKTTSMGAAYGQQADTLNGAAPGSEDRSQEQQEANKPPADDAPHDVSSLKTEMEEMRSKLNGITAGPTGEQGDPGEADHTPEYKTD